MNITIGVKPVGGKGLPDIEAMELPAAQSIVGGVQSHRGAPDAMKFFHAILTAALFIFFAIMVTFRFTEGSFKAAGERMDRLMGQTADEVGSAAEDVADVTGQVVDDIADGPDGKSD